MSFPTSLPLGLRTRKTLQTLISLSSLSLLLLFVNEKYNNNVCKHKKTSKKLSLGFFFIVEPSFFINVRKSWKRFFLWDQPRLTGRIYCWQKEGRLKWYLHYWSWRGGGSRRVWGSWDEHLGLRPSWLQLHFGTQYVLWQHPGFPASSGAGGHTSSSLSLASSWDPAASLNISGQTSSYSWKFRAGGEAQTNLWNGQKPQDPSYWRALSLSWTSKALSNED